jgi:photosystem II stability/assembly factor-like uncharacterized protein
LGRRQELLIFEKRESRTGMDVKNKSPMINRINNSISRRTRVLISLILLSLILVSLAIGINGIFGKGSWKNIGPEGGSIISLAINPVNDNIVYAGTTSNVYKSVNGGITWIAISAALDNHRIYNIAIDPEMPTTLYVGTDYPVVFKSTDGGKTWNALNVSKAQDLSFPGLIVDPVKPSTLYAYTYYEGFMNSTDGGKNWNLIHTVLSDVGVNVLVSDPVKTATLYAGTVSGIYKSTDGGANWSGINSGLPTESYEDVVYPIGVNTLATAAADPQTLYAGTDQGIFRSIDDGTSWTDVNTGLPELTINTLAIDPADPHTLYAGTYASHLANSTSGGKVYKSTDGGKSWNLVYMDSSSKSINVIAIDPIKPNILFLGTGKSFEKSIDGGRNWISCLSGITNTWINVLAYDPSIPNRLYMAEGDNVLYQSIIGSRKWNKVHTFVDATQVFSLAIDMDAHTTLYAGTDNGVYKSTDRGSTWRAASHGSSIPQGDYVGSLAIDPVRPTVLYAGTLGDGVYKSMDGGKSWFALNTGCVKNARVYQIAVTPQMPNVIYAATNIICKSTDGGESWSAVSKGLPGSLSDTIAIDPDSPMTLYAGTFGGIFKSTDGGANWIAINHGLPIEIVASIVIDPTRPNRIYASIYGHGVYKSVDSGGSWSPMNDGLRSDTAFDLLVNPITPTILYAGTAGDGVFVIDDMP